MSQTAKKPISPASDIGKVEIRSRQKQPSEHSMPGPTVSPDTKTRLYAEAREHPAFAGMAVADLRASIDYRLDAFLSKQPFWYGHTGGPEGADIRHHASQLQYKTRREKEEEDRTTTKKRPAEKPPVTAVPVAEHPMTNLPMKGGDGAVRSRGTESAGLIAA